MRPTISFSSTESKSSMSPGSFLPRYSTLYLGIVTLFFLIAYQGSFVLHADQLITFKDASSGVHHQPSGRVDHVPKQTVTSPTRIQKEEFILSMKNKSSEATATTIPSVRKEPSVTTSDIKTADSTTDVISNNTKDLPWKIAAPAIDTIIPVWMEAYAKFHNQSLHDAHQQTKDTDKHKYIIFMCQKSCSGTGNRQRAIMATFIVAVLTKRILLIDITHPVRIDSILQPHLIRWNWFPPHLNDLKSKLLKLRNKNPAVLDLPSKFLDMGQQVIRIEANSPVNLEQQWRTSQVREHLEVFGLPRSSVVPGNLYKQIFWALYKPSEVLTEAAVALRQKLGVNEPGFKYIVVHARTGGGGVGWKDNDRFATDKLDNLYGNAKMVRQSLLRSGTNASFPIVVVSDDAKAKELLHNNDPAVVRYADTKIIHVDRSKQGVNDLEGSLAVWADLLVMAQATCIVKGRGSFSMLGAWLATGQFGSVCMQLVV